MPVRCDSSTPVMNCSGLQCQQINCRELHLECKHRHIFNCNWSAGGEMSYHQSYEYVSHRTPSGEIRDVVSAG